jgi:CBS domain-containing protein
MQDVSQFLGAHAFDQASEQELASVVSSVEIDFFPDGAFLLRTTSANEGYVFVIRTGEVELISAGAIMDVLGEGELVGLPSLISDLPPGLDVRAAGDVLVYRIPADSLLPLLAGRPGMRFLARMVRDRQSMLAHGGGPGAGVESVNALMRPTLVVDGTAAMKEVIAELRDQDVSCVLVRMPDGELGIITDRDLRNRVLAPGLDLETAAADVATSPATAVPPQTTADEAVITLPAQGIRRLPVVTEHGQVLGVVEDVDLLASQSRTPVRVRRAISRARNPRDLVQIAQEARTYVIGSIREGMPAPTITSIHSTLIAPLVAKAVDLHVDEIGPAPVPFVWLVTGSVARREAVLSSDLDSLLAWDGTDEHRPWMRALALGVLTTLAACGLSHDDHGVRADKNLFARSVDSWRDAVSSCGPVVVQAFQMPPEPSVTSARPRPWSCTLSTRRRCCRTASSGPARSR